MDEEAVIAAARAYRAALDELGTHRQQRKDASALPDRDYRARLIALTEDVGKKRWALLDVVAAV